MKRLYKVTALFLLIFSIGIYVSIKSINSFFTSNTSVEPILVSTTAISKTTQVLVISFINN